MESFDHVHSDFIRSVLTGENVDIKDIHGAAYATEHCMVEDWKSTLIPFEVMEAREAFVDQMEDCICKSDYAGAVDAMRGFWSI
jgi:hypothetical protein